MKWILVLLVLVFLMTTQAQASDRQWNKLKRGAENIVTSPVEVVKQTRYFWIKGSEKTWHLSAWVLCGAVKGFAMGVARIGSGLWDVVTFPVAVPSNYDSVVRPPIVFEEWPVREAGVVYKNIGDPLK